MAARRRPLPLWMMIVSGLIVIFIAYAAVVTILNARSLHREGQAEAAVVQPQLQRFATTPAGCTGGQTAVQAYDTNTQYAIKRQYSCTNVTARELDAAVTGQLAADSYAVDSTPGTGLGWGCNIASDHDGLCYDVVSGNQGHVNARYVISVPAPNPLPAYPSVGNLGNSKVTKYTLALTYAP